MKILVIGGAGYIGSHTVLELKKDGYDVVVFDDLSTGNKESIGSDVKFYEESILNIDALNKVMADEKPDAVINFAAKLIVPESVENPALYYKVNVGGVSNIIQAMHQNGINNLVFSSTAAVYGSPNVDSVDEKTPTNPESPYGASKLAAEDLIRYSKEAYGINSVILRYFNVAGADDSGKIGLASSGNRVLTHLIPVVIETAQQIRESMEVFGNDYDTKDGTCIRDYIHVTDLALAHISALKWMKENNDSNLFNLGSNEGYSIMEVINTVEKVSKVNVNYKIGKRRPGDSVKIVASAKKAMDIMGWKTERSLEKIVLSDWNWRKNNPNGFKK